MGWCENIFLGGAISSLRKAIIFDTTGSGHTHTGKVGKQGCGFAGLDADVHPHRETHATGSGGDAVCAPNGTLVRGKRASAFPLSLRLSRDCLDISSFFISQLRNPRTGTSENRRAGILA